MSAAIHRRFEPYLWNHAITGPLLLVLYFNFIQSWLLYIHVINFFLKAMRWHVCPGWVRSKSNSYRHWKMVLSINGFLGISRGNIASSLDAESPYVLQIFINLLIIEKDTTPSHPRERTLKACVSVNQFGGWWTFMINMDFVWDEHVTLAQKPWNSDHWENHFALKSCVHHWSCTFWNTLFLQLLDEEEVAALLGPKTGVTAWIAAVKRATSPHFDEVHKMLYRSISLRTNQKRTNQSLDDSSIGNGTKTVTIVSKLWLKLSATRHPYPSQIFLL